MSLPLLVYILGIYESLYSWIHDLGPESGTIFLAIIFFIITFAIAGGAYTDMNFKELPINTKTKSTRKKIKEESEKTDKEESGQKAKNFIHFYASWFNYIIKPKYIKIFIAYIFCINVFQIFAPQPKVFYTMVGAYYVQKAADQLDKEAIKEELKVLPPNILKAINATLEKTFEEAIAEANGLVTETTEIAKDSLKEISKEATTKVIEKIKE